MRLPGQLRIGATAKTNSIVCKSCLRLVHDYCWRISERRFFAHSSGTISIVNTRHHLSLVIGAGKRRIAASDRNLLGPHTSWLEERRRAC